MLLFAAIVFLGSGEASSADVPPPYQALIERVAAYYEIDSALFSALVDVESGRRPAVVSSKGAQGLAQLMPATARRFGVRDRSDPEENLHGAARYLKWLLHRYEGDVRLALAGYNAGEGHVDRYGGVPPFPETRSFVASVMARAGMGSAATVESGGRKINGAIRLIRSRNGDLVFTNK